MATSNAAHQLNEPKIHSSECPSEDTSEKLNDLKIDNNTKHINILLLGESGVGKSTFINSFANYLHFEDFENAEQAGPLVLIPSTIIMYDKNYKEKIIKNGTTDKNGYQETGEYAKTYVFPIGENKRLRLIDTPGIDDTRGIKQDNLNCENILGYLSHLKELHGICCLLKAKETRIRILEYCLKEILSRLEKSASRNIIFIITNTRAANYTGGETLPCLKKVIKKIHVTTPSIKIPLNPNNVFCFDNEAFRFLIAIKNDWKFKKQERKSFEDSWNVSVEECFRMIQYITTLQPHGLEGTMSINDSRRLILQLCKPLAEISELINDNLRVLERRQQKLSKSNLTIDDLKKKLFMPVVDLEVTKLNQPVTVCNSTKCTDMYQVGDSTKKHYCQRCHEPCYLRGVPKEIVGDLTLINCASMHNGNCSEGNCCFTAHMQVYYLTKTFNSKVINYKVQANIKNENEVIKYAEEMVKEITERMKEYEEERNIITKILGKFTHFLQNNALTQYNDAYENYIKYLIGREKHLGRHADKNTLNHLNQLLKQYEQYKIVFENAFNLYKNVENNEGTFELKPSDIMECVSQLFSLKHNGKKIRELVESQKSSRNSEYSCEYIHPIKNVINSIRKGVKKHLNIK